MNLEKEIKNHIREIPDFPKPGILFKDITPLLANAELNNKIIDAYATFWSEKNIDAIAGIESRGFLWGNALAMKMGIPFIPIRKEGKLPSETLSSSYELEYGNETIEIHTDALKKGQNVLIHDDLIATGGTALAAKQLVEKTEAKVTGFAFLISLGYLDGSLRIMSNNLTIQALATY